MDAMNKYYCESIAQYINAIPANERYGFLMYALGKVNRENDRGFLLAVAAGLNELLTDVVERSGAEIIHPGTQTIN